MVREGLWEGDTGWHRGLKNGKGSLRGGGAATAKAEQQKELRLEGKPGNQCVGRG